MSNIKTENELIAEFMGECVFQNEAEMREVHIEKLRPYYYVNQLKYDSDWNQLHPVLEKIAEQLDDLKEEHNIVPVFEDEYSHPWEIPMTTRIVDAHSAAVNLIKFLNDHHQNKN